MEGYVSEIVSALQNFTTYTEQRTQLQSEELGEALAPNSRLLCEELGKGVAYIKPMIGMYSAFAASVRSNQFSLVSIIVQFGGNY